MSKVVEEQLNAGFIFGDVAASEYIYLPGGEIGIDNPLCVFEKGDDRRDISLEEAVSLVSRLSLKPVKHPWLGYRSC